MNIPICPLESDGCWGEIVCPSCHGRWFRKHGCYWRKGFHRPEGAQSGVIAVQRYRCLSVECGRRTFSVLPVQVLRYCRFLWPELLDVQQALRAGLSRYHLARRVWQVGRGVIVRAAQQLKRMGSWMGELHRELSEGKPERPLRQMVKLAVAKLGRVELVERWYRHRYPMRAG